MAINVRYTFDVGTYFGIPVRVHFTFPLILALFGVEAWMGGTWQDGLYAMALVGAVFVCVVLHEFGHSLQVVRYGIPVRDIVLLPIGGMARAERIPEKPREEIIVAISGPLVNVAIAGVIVLIMLLRDGGLQLRNDFATNLLVINVILALFNLIPAFPMDGGRILRGILAMRFSYLRATRYARSVGQIIAVIFVVVGFTNTSFIMLPIIAVFVFFGATNEENMIRVRYALEGKSMGEVAGEQPILLTDDTVVVAAEHFKKWNDPVVGITDMSRSITGVIHRRDVEDAVRNGESGMPLSGLMHFDVMMVPAELSALEAYYTLARVRPRCAGVIDGGIYLGVVPFDSYVKRATSGA